MLEDISRRFLFDELGIRGQWVRLEQSWQTSLSHQQSSASVLPYLGQALAAVVLLTSTIKFEGSLILQAQGSGPLRTLVAQATHDGKIRGLVRGSLGESTDSLQALFGEGRLVLTISNLNGQAYQGVVSLLGKNLANALESYFLQSEQINTRLWLYADGQRSTGLLLQQLPGKNQDDEDWNRVELLAGTLTDWELHSLSCEELLHRLFHEEKLRLFPAQPVIFECACSRTKIENTLRLLGRQELVSILEEQEQIEVNCEFCNQKYTFDPVDIEQLLHEPQDVAPPSESRH